MKYDVHLYAVMRYKYTGIEAESQTGAIDAAVKLFNADTPPAYPPEFAEDIAYYLVDEEGDEEYARSYMYNDAVHADLFADRDYLVYEPQ